MTIDPDLLPAVALLDTGVFIRALGDRPDDPRSEACRLFFKAMQDHDRTMLVAAPSFAEATCGNPNLPVTPHIEVVAFDKQSAKLFCQLLPGDALGLLPKKDRQWAKFDAQILACAKRHKATCAVTLDGKKDFTLLASQLKIPICKPDDFAAAQYDLDDEMKKVSAGPA